MRLTRLLELYAHAIWMTFLAIKLIILGLEMNEFSTEWRRYLQEMAHFIRD